MHSENWFIVHFLQVHWYNSRYSKIEYGETWRAREQFAASLVWLKRPTCNCFGKNNPPGHTLDVSTYGTPLMRSHIQIKPVKQRISCLGPTLSGTLAETSYHKEIAKFFTTGNLARCGSLEVGKITDTHTSQLQTPRRDVEHLCKCTFKGTKAIIMTPPPRGDINLPSQVCVRARSVCKQRDSQCKHTQWMMANVL